MNVTEQTPPQSSTLVHPGLTSADVAERQQRGETNAYQPRTGRSYWDIVRDNFLNLFNITLTALLIVVFFFRDWATLFTAGFSVITNTILGTLQEVSAKRKLDQLAAMAAKEVQVYRDGQLITLPAREIVKDEVILLTPGALLPVDGDMIAVDALEMDESQLTGESDPVEKAPGHPVTSGSYVLAGTGLMRATRIGRDSTVNQLTSIAKAFRRILTPTQQKVSALVELTILAMFVLGGSILIAGWMQNKAPLDIARDLVVLITSLVPQGLVLVSTLSLTVGAILISRHRTLIQRVNAVESVSNATVLCFDKTGTLTRNELCVSQVIPLGGADEADIVAALRDYTANIGSHNTTSQAILTYLETRPPRPDAPAGRRKLREIPFASSRKWGAIIFPDHTLVLGASDRLLAHSANGVGETALLKADALAETGLRVLAFGRVAGALDAPDLNNAVQPLALLVLSDQLRDDIRETLDRFRALNVSLKILSGDHLKTVRAIAYDAGLPIDKAYTGDQIDAMSDAELDGVVRDTQLFARISPEGKRRVIRALQKQGEYVAMVGDGVNDVPALKAANLAVVMNNGARIAKDVADIILLNNAMTTLPLAFQKGGEITRTIYATAIMFLAKNAFITLLMIFAAVMTLPFPISPTQTAIATFFTSNLQGGLYGLGLIKPRMLTQFRRDVLDFVITSGIVGAVALAALYFVTYRASGFDVVLSRSALTIYILLYGTYIFWWAQGVEFLRPRTFIENRWSVILGGLLAVVGLIAPYLLAGVIGFVPLPPLIVGLVTVLFLLNVVLVEIMMRARHPINQLWKLAEP
ncbi:MAG: HAD-IC family P-type ATPase [bacterium]|nr:HAD-IC family P-type ATPase [bacterium]